MKLKTSELIMGIPILLVAGTIFHFLFEWTGFFIPTAWLFAVNEAPWEHTKLVFFPMVIYMLITYPFVKKEANNIFLAKIVHYAIGVFFIVGVFFAYSIPLGEHYLPIDISLFVLGTIFGLIASYKIQKAPQISKPWHYITLILFIVIIGLVIWWTYDPPKLMPFQDVSSFEYISYGPAILPH